jgi:enamine deaminase RidA (YjgF/YER057c/UK114 family)
MPGQIEARLKELKIELPQPVPPRWSYVPSVRTGDLLFISGQICHWQGENRFTGKLGGDIALDQGKEAARLCGLNILAQAKAALDGDLDRVKRCVKLVAFVSSMPGFTDQPLVANACSELIGEVFGEAGKHARSAVGVAALPGNVAVEIEAIFEVR